MVIIPSAAPRLEWGKEQYMVEEGFDLVAVGFMP
jgi:hypothetical protein